jgi:hypothetical protein
MNMSLTTRSINEVAKKRARRARVKVELAEEKLKAANETLERAIPQGDTEQIKVAHVETQQAEEAVAHATQDLEVVETLLDVENPAPSTEHTSSGEGLKSLIRRLHGDDEA